MLQPRLLNPSGMAVSIVTHLTVLTVGLGYAGVRPFETAPVEAIAVDLVSPSRGQGSHAETPPKPATPLEIPDLSARDQPAAASAPAAAPPPQQPQRQPAAVRGAPPQGRRAKQAAIQPAAAASSAGAATRTSWRPPEPDLSVKYQVNLGLPARPGGDDFDASAFSAAKVRPMTS